jgi:hypothetical protein
MRSSRLAVGLVVAMLGACSPTQPTRECGNIPPLPDVLTAICSLNGSIASCQARTEGRGLYCTAAGEDVTSSVRWISTNPSVGRFLGPGRFEFSTPGTTVIYAQDSRLVSTQSYAYAVSESGLVRQVFPIDVSVVDRRSNEFLSSATVQFTFDGGPTQTCRLDVGLPFVPCRFWFDVFEANVSPGGPRGVVVASRPGYSTESETVTLRPPTCPTCAPSLVMMRLSPAS